ncbi:putative blue-light-activated sensor histidine kinase (FixL-like) [Magnetospirillum sp. XM-1]|uniref:PAS domain S-box protein n=1 Tax=Magnetospirillum sp. XM-1 TaxID=1663591 RepID=UPI00073DE1EA|nr:PAS domain S-box protein [Magnetospirillum sp. XM-1]CUW39988.1 putative blue-light-activated sensor histidine kinase (FixL-like) [Magnetospirillum sp. XM-1]
MPETRYRAQDLLVGLYRRQAAVIGALLLLTLAGYQSQDWLISHMSDDGALINVAGRQRMLSQRSVAIAHQMAAASSPDERTMFADLLAQAGSEMGAGHARLIGESRARGMSAEMEQLYFGGAPSLDAEVTDFVADVRRLAASDGLGIGQSSPRLRALADKSRLTLLPGLERLVVRYQDESRQNVARLRQGFTLGLYLVIAVLGLSWFGVFRPMARRLREEFAAHQAAVEHNHLILESMGEGIIGLDRNGAVTFANPAASSMLGFAPWEMLGRSLHQLIHHTRPDGSEYPSRECPLARTLATGEDCSVEGEWFWRRDGSSFPVHYGSTAIVKEGALIGAVVTFRDLSDVTATRRALEASEQIKSSILDAALDAIVTIDRSGMVVEFNPAAERIFGRRATDALGMEVSDLIIPEAHREAHRRGLARVAAGHGSTVLGKRLEMSGLHADGHEIPLELTITHLSDHGLFTAFIRDISEQKQTEAALRRSQKMEAVGQLTGGIAHDFNNLLGIITGNLELLERAVQGNEAGQRRVDTALRSARRGADLTRRLLSFSRQDPKAQGKSLTDLNEAVSGMQEMIQRSLTRMVEVRTRLTPDAWPADINRSEFEDCLLNLCLNARDAMPKGGLLTIETANMEIDAEFRRADPNMTPGRYVLVSISDTGTGIPKDILDRIFEPFFTTKERGKGTGLGLSMAYGFAKRSGGHIRVYSEPGIGTTFRLYLPKASTGAAIGTSADLPAEAPPTGSEHILIVDDEPHLAEIAGEFLTELGYRVTIRTHAAEALALLRDDPDIQLLFTDVVMPDGLDGYGLERSAREMGHGCAVLLTSGFTGYAVEHKDRHGEILSKPYGKTDLARAVRKALDERERKT